MVLDQVVLDQVVLDLADMELGLEESVQVDKAMA